MAISKGIVTAFGNTPQARDDAFTSTGLNGNALGNVILNVMGNDEGGNAKSLWALDDGISAGGIRPTDLLNQDTARTAALSTDASANGAKIWITPAGTVSYDASTLSDAFKAELLGLGADGSLTDTFTYAIRLGNGALSWATATVRIDGVNDAPTGTPTAVLAVGAEDTLYTVNAADLLAGFNDVDVADTLNVTNLTASDGSIADNGNGTYTISPTANFNGGVILNYDVVDGNGGSIAATQGYILAAVNDAPTGAPTALLAAGTEDIPYTINAADLLAGFSDIDGDTLGVSNLMTSNGSVTNNSNGTFTITPTKDYNGNVTLDYDVTDGNGGSIAATQSYTLTPVSDISMGFEEGFAGWSTIGSTSIVANGAPEGHYYALLNSNSNYSQNTLESFLGIGSNAIDSITTGTATNGSAIKTTLSLNAGDTVMFDWRFSTSDYVPYYDNSFYTSLNGQLIKLADVGTVGNYGSSGWQTKSFTVGLTGVYTIGFGVVNEGDSGVNSTLSIDNLHLI